MVKYWLSIFAIVLVVANNKIEPEISSVGQSCDGYPPYEVTSFNINPWPPAFGHNMNIAMGGTFQMSVPVAYLATGQSCNYQNWQYTQFPINKNYTAGQTQSFDVAISSGSSKGNCYLQVTLHGAPPQELFITCWEVNYQLS